MLKADVLAKLEEYKGRPIELETNDGAVFHCGIDGHWFFVQGENLVEIKVNVVDTTYGYASINQSQRPFTITVVPFDAINYVRSYIENTSGDIETALSSLTPVGTTKTMDIIKAEIEGNSIRKSHSPSGNLNNEHAALGGSCSNFKGSMISTEIDGIPKCYG